MQIQKELCKKNCDIGFHCFNSIDVKKYIDKNIEWCLTFVGMYTYPAFIVKFCNTPRHASDETPKPFLGGTVATPVR
jgi:hypothetical protein